MSEPILNFAKIIAPITEAAFFAENWEVKPLHLARSQPAFYEHLLTREDVESMISSGGLRFPGIQLAKGGRFFPPEAFTMNIRSGDDYFTGVPNIGRVVVEYRSGATISLPGFHRAWKPLGALAASIEDQFGHAVHANVYVTPGNEAGFTPHFDTHDIFILQIAGFKHWNIHEAPVVLPHRGQSFDARIVASSRKLLEVDLAPGDLLYLPRGFVHSTATSESFSMHVTLGMTVYTWVELLSEWAQTSRNNANFRRALVPGFATRAELADAMSTALPALISELQKGTDFAALVAAFTDRVRRARSIGAGEFTAGPG